MKAIVTKYHGCTNTLPARITASAEGVKTITVSLDDHLNIDENHRAAAMLLAQKYGWSTRLISGGLPNGSVAHTFAPKRLVNVLQRLGQGERSGGVMGEASIALDELELFSS